MRVCLAFIHCKHIHVQQTHCYNYNREEQGGYDIALLSLAEG